LRDHQTTLHAVPLSVNAVGGALLPVHEPLKPGGELSVAPGAIDPLYDRFVIETVPPDCIKEPFQSCVMVCPLANENCRSQLLMGVVPVFVIARLAPKPPGHWLVIA
jgi:hypothetical protein